MGGAQAQVLSAAQMSIWARVKSATVQRLDAALWREKSLVRAWAMRRTMFLLPSDELALYARGTQRRSLYNLRWAEERVGSRAVLGRLLDEVLEFLGRPRTRSDLARHLAAKGHRLRSRAGGGWGDSRAVPWVAVGGASLSVGFLLHIIDARDVICAGPSAGNESTYVRADRWLPHWKDIPVEEAERELLTRYLRSFGPATLADFALWTGMYVRDAREIWSPRSAEMARVEVGGLEGYALSSDLPELESAELRDPAVRLLPFFDSYMLGHRSHRDMVDESHHKQVYRPQGWVSPVLLVDGRAQGVWSHTQLKDSLEVVVKPFTRLPGPVKSCIEEEAAGLGRFFGCAAVKTTIG